MSEDMLANPPLEYASDAPTTSPPFYDPALLDIARTMSWTTIGAIGAVLLASIISLVRLRAGVLGLAAIIAAVPLSFAPSAIRLFLPWEDPWTGAGSPMASLMGIVFLAGFFFCLVGAPAILLAVLVLPQSKHPTS